MELLSDVLQRGRRELKTREQLGHLPIRQGDASKPLPDHGVEGADCIHENNGSALLPADSYFLLNINAGAKDVRQATGNWSGSFAEGDIGLKCGANIPLGNRQSVVGTVNVMKRYIMENLPAIRTAGSGAISCPVGGSYNDVVLTANTADLITIGLSGSARNGGTLFITETIGQLIDVWSQASTGN